MDTAGLHRRTINLTDSLSIRPALESHRPDADNQIGLVYKQTITAERYLQLLRLRLQSEVTDVPG